MNACKIKYRHLLVICLNKTGAILKSVSIKEPYPYKEAHSKPKAISVQGSTSQKFPQLRGMRGNQAHAFGDYYHAAEALNSVAIKPIRIRMRTSLLEALGRVYKRCSSAASSETSKEISSRTSRETSRRTSEKGITQSESS